MRKRRNSIHSNSRHRSRNLKRRLRNMTIEVLFLIMLIFVAIKFARMNDEIPKVAELNIEEQKKIIQQEMKKDKEKDVNTKRLETKFVEENMITIETVLIYQEETDETIVNCNIVCNMEEIPEQILWADILDKKDNIVTTIYFNMPYLKNGQKTRINIVLNGKLEDAEKIQIHK